MDDAGQLYVSLEFGQTVVGESEEEIKNEMKKMKRSYARVVSDGTTACSASVRSLKENKNWREVCEYLRSRKIDRTRILRRVGNVLVCQMAALRQVEEEEEVGSRQQQGTVVRCCNCGATHLHWDKRGWERLARRDRQRVN